MHAHVCVLCVYVGCTCVCVCRVHKCMHMCMGCVCEWEANGTRIKNSVENSAD